MDQFDLFYYIYLYIFNIQHEKNLATTSNFHHKSSFSSSIDWRSQKLGKSCATGSEVKNTSKFYKIPVGDHSHKKLQDLQINSYYPKFIELSVLCSQ